MSANPETEMFCPHCGVVNSVPTSPLTTAVVCKACHHSFSLPARVDPQPHKPSLAERLGAIIEEAGPAAPVEPKRYHPLLRTYEEMKGYFDQRKADLVVETAENYFNAVMLLRGDGEWLEDSYTFVGAGAEMIARLHDMATHAVEPGFAKLVAPSAEKMLALMLEEIQRAWEKDHTRERQPLLQLLRQAALQVRELKGRPLPEPLREQLESFGIEASLPGDPVVLSTPTTSPGVAGSGGLAERVAGILGSTTPAAPSPAEALDDIGMCSKCGRPARNGISCLIWVGYKYMSGGTSDTIEYTYTNLEKRRYHLCPSCRFWWRFWPLLLWPLLLGIPMHGIVIAIGLAISGGHPLGALIGGLVSLTLAILAGWSNDEQLCVNAYNGSWLGVPQSGSVALGATYVEGLRRRQKVQQGE